MEQPSKPADERSDERRQSSIQTSVCTQSDTAIYYHRTSVDTHSTYCQTLVSDRTTVMGGKHSDTLYTHKNKPITSSSFKTFENPPHHSFETYCVLHRKSKSTFKSNTISSNVTLSHTTSSKTKKFL